MKTTNTNPHLNTRKRVQLSFNKPSLTEQTHKSSCNINNIVKKFTETGILPSHMYENPQYGTAPDLDLKTALDLVQNLNQEFKDLNADIQAKFGNNPDQYAQFLSDYAEAPESFTFQSETQTDTSVSKTNADTKQDATTNADGGS